jgi:cobalamin synthase
LTTGAKNGSPFPTEPAWEAAVPTLLRFLTIVGILVGLFYGSMFVLANFFEPQPHEMTKSIRDAKIK